MKIRAVHVYARLSSNLHIIQYFSGNSIISRWHPCNAINSTLVCTTHAPLANHVHVYSGDSVNKNNKQLTYISYSTRKKMNDVLVWHVNRAGAIDVNNPMTNTNTTSFTNRATDYRADLFEISDTSEFDTISLSLSQTHTTDVRMRTKCG